MNWLIHWLLNQSIIPSALLAGIIRLRVLLFFSSPSFSLPPAVRSIIRRRIPPTRPPLVSYPELFYRSVLGDNFCTLPGDWSDTHDYHSAQHAMYTLLLQRSGSSAHEKIAILGDSWASFAIFCAKSLPSAQFFVLCNTPCQRMHIDRCCYKHSLQNIHAYCLHSNDFSPAVLFDRIILLEGGLSLWNIDNIRHRLRSWLRPQGFIFLQCIICPHITSSMPFTRWCLPILSSCWNSLILRDRNYLSTWDKHFILHRQWRLAPECIQRSYAYWLKRLRWLRVPIIRALASQDYSGRMVWRQWQMGLLSLYYAWPSFYMQHSLFQQKFIPTESE